MDAQEIFERINARETTAVVAAIEAEPTLAAARDRCLGSTPLIFAAHRGLLAIVEALLQAGADVRVRERVSDSIALHWAAEGGHAEVARALLARGSELEVRDSWHRLTPLGWATCVEWAPRLRDDRPATIAVLREAGAQADVFCALGLRDAVLLERIVVADRAVLAARLGFVDQAMTPLLFAVSRRDRALAERLIALGASVGDTTAWGISALAIAMRAGDVGMQALLREHGARDDASCAMLTGDTAGVPAGVADLPAAVVQGLLYAAAAMGCAGAIAPLAARGAEVDAVVEHLLDEVPAQVTAMHLATQAGHVEVVRELLRAGAQPGPRASGSDVTPLHLAAMRDDIACVRALLDGGADREARDRTFGATPLGFAEHGRASRAMALLREA